MPRFAILHHETPTDAAKPDHFDLLLEEGSVLKTFTLWQFPQIETTVAAIPDFDHRMVYLEYEGPISKNRGHVQRVDAGTFEWIEQTAERIVVQLAGQKLDGKLTLVLQSSAGVSGSDGNSVGA